MNKKIDIKKINCLLQIYNEKYGTSYKLKSNIYVSYNTKNLILEDDEGYKYSVSYDSIIKNFKRGSYFCIVDGFNDFSILNIQKYLNNNDINLKLISDVYISAKSKLKLYCNIHGVIEISWDDISHNVGCNKCFGNFHPSDIEIIEVLNKYNKVVNKTYSWVSGKYKNALSKTLIILDEHGYYYNISYWNIKTNLDSASILSPFYTFNIFSIMNIKTYLINNNFSYELISKKYKNVHNYLEFNCKKHGLFKMTWNNFYNNNQRCPICNESKGENKIREWLESNNVQFKPQYKFKNLFGIGGRLLRFDFAIFEDEENDKVKLKYLIEYDGEFHYEKIYEDDGYEILQYHDKLKNEYCKTNNIPLLRIPYWDFNNIEGILEKELSKYDLKVI